MTCKITETMARNALLKRPRPNLERAKSVSKFSSDGGFGTSGIGS
jgi:hypothetical protein